MGNDTGHLLKYVVVVAVVAVLALSVYDWDPSAPTVSGWYDLQALLQTGPFDDAPEWPSFGNYTDTFSDTVDFTCTPNVTYLGINCLWNVFEVFFSWVVGGFLWFVGAIAWLIVSAGTFLWFIGLFLVWLAELVVGFFVALIGTAFLIFGGVPPAVQVIMWVFIVPFLALLFFLVIRLVRGQS